MTLVSTLARVWEECIIQAGPPKRKIISLAGLPGVGKSTCLNKLRSGRMPAVITDEREFLTEEDEKQAVHADKTLTLDQGNPGLVEQTRIFVGAETRRCDMLLDQTSLNEWAILCGGVEITVMVLEMLAHRGFVDIGTVQDTAYRNLVNMRSSATIVLQASVKVREDRVRERVAATKKDEDRSKFVELVSEIYLPWLERVVPRVITLDTTNLSSEEVALRVGAILRMLTTER